MKNNLALKATLMAAAVFAFGTSLAYAEPVGQYLDDATITTKVKTAIMTDSQLKGSSISVETDNGSVHLNGLVTTKAQEKQAINDANGVNGIKDVQDNLTIASAQMQE